MEDKFQLTNSEFINKKYKQFYEKNGYIPEMFNPYNCQEIIDICPTITAAIGTGTTSADVWIVKDYDFLLKNRE